MINILIVDDKPENLYLLQSILDTNGFKTISAKNGAEALDLMKNSTPELIITDILMPVMDGFTLCRECKKDERLKSIPFFFYTATYTEEKDKEYALSLGADRFILKPQEPDEFIKIINDFLTDATNRKIQPKKNIEQSETVELKEYNAVLIRKIEDKMLQTDKAEKELRQYSKKLESEILERKRNEESLRESQSLFKTLAQVSPVGIFQTTPEGNTIYVNPKWCELSGLAQKDAIGKGWLKAVHPDDREMLSEKWSAESKKGIESTAEYRFQKPDGSVIWVIGKAVPILSGKKIEGYIGTITDITKHKTAEEALRKSQVQLSNALRAARLGPWEYDVKNDLFFFNDLFYSILHTTAENVGGYTMKSADYASRFVHPDDILMVGEEIKNALEADNPNYFRQLEHRIIFPDGNIGYITVSFSVIKNEQGETIRTFGVNQDITELKRMRNKIIESEAYYRTLFEGANDAILIMSGDVFVECNEKTISMFACNEKEDIINHHPWEFSPAIQPDGSESKAKTNEYIKTILEGKPLRFYWKHSKKNGDLFDAEISLNRIEIREKTFIQALVTDISNRKKAEEDLIRAKEKAEESDKLKTAFLNNISHEIRTPLNAITGFSSLLSEPGIDDLTRSSFIETIVQGSDHLLEIISDILEISNLDAGTIKLSKTHVEINPIIKNLYSQFKPKTDEKNLEFRYYLSLSDQQAIVVTDKTKLIQITSNLLSNAIKFTSEGQVNIGYDIIDEGIRFYVSDTGTGIPHDYHDRIFDRFYQIDHGLERLYEGTGLGLSICKEFIRLLGGDIWITSKPGAGSTFYFTIPFDKNNISTFTSKSKITDKELFFPDTKTILVAEDIESNFKLINYFLSNTNSVIVRAKNGKEAVELALSGSKIDLILMDIKMPEMDGYEAISIIHKSKPEIPIIAQSAYADDKSKIIEAGCSGFVTKPFDKRKLFESIIELNI